MPEVVTPYLDLSTPFCELKSIGQEIKSDLLYSLRVNVNVHLPVSFWTVNSVELYLNTLTPSLVFLGLNDLQERVIDVHILDVLLNGS